MAKITVTQAGVKGGGVGAWNKTGKSKIPFKKGGYLSLHVLIILMVIFESVNIRFCQEGTGNLGLLHMD